MVRDIPDGLKRMISRKPVLHKVKWENLFSLNIPDAWTFHEEDGVISLFDDKDGVGVIQISFAKRKSQQEPTVQEAIDFATSYASQRGWAVSTKSVYSLNVGLGKAPASEISTQENIDGELNYWRVWHVMGKERMAFITYNCLVSDKNTEATLCDLIIGSFEWI
jgi:hypothetical protein